jgi:predicted house-cleaning noncanonical NTP pyrophosphatase (MazG superfamily)
MPIFQFNKLVRDKLPQLYVDLRQTIISRKLTGAELLIALRRKLIEEAGEVPFESGTREEIINELSDVEQVMKDIKSETNITDEEVEAARQRKFNEKGGFSDGIFVEQIKLHDDDKWVEYYRAELLRYPEIPVVAGMKEVGKKPTLEPGRYRHYKGGTYVLVDLACHTETLEWYVVYQSEERKRQNLPSIWIRPYDMFVEIIELNGEMKPRFQKI